MGIPVNSKEWPRFVLPIVRHEWEQKKDAVVSPLAPFFGEDDSQSSVEYSQGIGAFDEVPEYNSDSAEGNSGGIEYDSFDPLYETTFTHKEYAKGTAIARKLWDDERTGQIKRKAQTLGLSFGTTIAKHRSSVLNNAFSSSVLGGDGKALCATDHPVNSVKSTTFSNKGTTAFSYDAVKAVLLAGKNMTDDRGNPMPVIYDTIIVPNALEADAYEILRALAKPGTTDNDANYLASKNLKVVVDPYLTDANNWFALDSLLSTVHLLWFWRVRPELRMDPQSDFNLVAKYRGYMRYSFGWDDARFIYGSLVS